MKIFTKIQELSKNFFFGTRENLPWEEISEKKTTKMWYFLLFCMFVSIFWTAIYSLSVIEDFFELPKRSNRELENLVNNLNPESENVFSTNYYGYYGNYFDEQEINLEISSAFTRGNVIMNEIKRLDSRLDSLYVQLKNLEVKYSRWNEDYKIALTEKIAGVADEVSEIKNSQNNNRDEVSRVNEEISELKKQILDLKIQNTDTYEILKWELERQQQKYKKDSLIYEISVKLTSLLFVGIIFGILFKIYSNLKTHNSSYTIIFSVATFAYGLILLGLFLNFLWSLIPDSIVNLISQFFQTFEIFLIILQFIWPVVIMWFFGFFVYKIQKRLYSKENVLKRIVIDKKCPNCSNSVDVSKPFCPFCSYELLDKCPHCSQNTIKWLDFCYNCGKKKKEIL